MTYRQAMTELEKIDLEIHYVINHTVEVLMTCLIFLFVTAVILVFI